MKTLLRGVLFILFFWPTAGHSSDMREIELMDGGVIAGEVKSFSDGVYTIQSEALGTLQLQASDIREIRKKSGKPAPPAVKSPEAAPSSPMDFQISMLLAAGLMELVMSLQQDPDVQRLSDDAALMEAFRQGDLVKALRNPSLTRVLQKPSVRAFTQRMAALGNPPSAK